MATNTNIEFLKLKVFLYKYTPPFTKKNVETESNALIDRYTVVLDEKYFSKFDITSFVSSYNFSQDISSNTFTWDLTLQDPVLTFDKIDQVYRVNEGQEGLRIRDLVANLAQYEDQSKNFIQHNTIEAAKLSRGKGQAEFVVKVGANLPRQTGIKLSDLIQPYDFISCFLYKSTTPLEDLRGVVSKHPITKFDVFEKNDSGRALGEADLQKETVLLSLDDCFNEFNGFVLNKNISSKIGSVDTVSISGNGLTQLFAATRRIMKGDVAQESLFNRGEITKLQDFTPFDHIYSNKTVEQIFTDLFDIVYRISVSPSELNSFGSFYDITKLIVSNTFQTNLFVLPPYLLALVMKRRGFHYLEPASSEALQSIIDQVTFTEESAEEALKNLSSGLQQSNLLGVPPVYISQELEVLKPYFLHVRDVLTFFNPELSTPFEVIDDIKAKTFLEFFERRDGVVIIRPPQYNDTDSTIFSSQVDVIASIYSEDVHNLISRQTFGYMVDMQESVLETQKYAYTNGKLLAQFGWLEASADANPNFKNDKPTNPDLELRRSSGLYRYAEYFLRIYNASLKTGIITMNYDPLVEVGKTFFDEKNSRFGYISGIEKTVDVTGNSLITIQLKYVRDAIRDPQDPSKLVFEQLDRLVDIAAKFSTTSVDTSIKDTGF